MNAKDLMDQILLESEMLALSTCVENVPYVRVMDCVYDVKRPGIIYLFTFEGSSKIKQFEKNNKVAVTTIPVGNHRYLRSRSATIQKSELAMDDVLDIAIAQIPAFDQLYEDRKDDFLIYEIHLYEVTVQDDMYQVSTLYF